jgi:3-oxoadipate enol-lactonase
VQLHAVRSGQGAGRLLVFSHALGLDHRMWDAVLPAFQATHSVLACDQRGHGRSPGDTTLPWSLDDLVDDAAALIQAQAAGPVVFIGLSMGGMVAQGLAIRHPQLLRGVVLAHTVACYSDAARQAWAQRIETVRAGGMAAVVDTVVARYLGDSFRASQPAAAAALRAQLLAMGPACYAAACQAVAGVDWLQALPAVRCPTLVVAGRHDLGAPVAEAERIARAVPGARLHILENSAHLSPVEEPAALVGVLQKFLQELP